MEGTSNDQPSGHTEHAKNTEHAEHAKNTEHMEHKETHLKSCLKSVSERERILGLPSATILSMFLGTKRKQRRI